ncbi:LysR family transcriptional regulator [Roseibium aggregatum]|uniref:LysR family transcriptional regulator n=1 Tax=Roseibium aggregatum TaxID=187304 RepID=A0A939E8N6_9HYPH|nr:LysR family transcriptional regulator [Roseibium aggregatum]MBN9668911.1 LysR family transcriptional regulator [Roseibium aggregatum]
MTISTPACVVSIPIPRQLDLPTSVGLELLQKKRINTMTSMNKIERLPIDPSLLHTFSTIAECGNLTVAAQRLGRTQSAISVQLRKLEESLETSLFVRSARGMALTSAGEALLSRAVPILSAIRDAADLFLEPLTGTIRVGLPDDFDEGVLERILSEFSQSRPGVQVLARSGCTSGYSRAIQAGDLDVAVCSGLDDPGGEPLGSEPIVWVAREGSVWSQNAPVPLAVLDRSCYWQDLPADVLRKAGRDHCIAFRSGSFSSLKAALRSGLAVGLLPQSCVSEGLTILTNVDGFPDLPVSHRSIQFSAQAPKTLAKAMVEAIKSARAA